MEYISTGTLPHVFHKDNVKISNNTSDSYSTKRLENNKLHKSEYTIIDVLLSTNIALIVGTQK